MEFEFRDGRSTSTRSSRAIEANLSAMPLATELTTSRVWRRFPSGRKRWRLQGSCRADDLASPVPIFSRRAPMAKSRSSG